jgi:hypothetical protein
MCLFLFVAVGFALFRQAPFYIWNDGHGAVRAQEWAQKPPLAKLFIDAFAALDGSGYRPLSTLFYVFSLRFLYAPEGPSVVHLLLIGSIYGALALSLLAVARRFTQHEVTAYFAVLLVLASPPLAATSWVILAGVQGLVPLVVCLGLLCYWRGAEGGKTRWLCRGVLAAMFLLGPWYREFLGILPLLVGFLEWQRARRLTILMGMAGLGLLHALYPTALVKLLVFSELPLAPVFALGNLANALGGGGLRWQASAHFLPLFPPILLVLNAIAGLYYSWARLGNVRGRFFFVAGAGAWNELLPALAFLSWLTLLPAIAVFDGTSWLLPLILCMGLAVTGLFANVFLSVWFLAAFLPILRVFTEHIHFLYAIPPASIILACTVEPLWLRASATRSLRAVTRPVLAACMVIVTLDQAANLYGVYRVNWATYGGIEQVARWLTRHVPAGSAVVSNVIHGEEIKWHAGDHVENYWTVAAGVFDPERVVDEPVRLQALLQRSAGKHVYYLDVDFDYTPWKASYHRHKYVHHVHVPRKDVGVVHRTRTSYLFIDPLRHLVPRDYIPFLGAPDLVNDFYLGRSHHRALFTYKVEAIYHLYRATGQYYWGDG